MAPLITDINKNRIARVVQTNYTDNQRFIVDIRESGVGVSLNEFSPLFWKWTINILITRHNVSTSSERSKDNRPIYSPLRNNVFYWVVSKKKNCTPMSHERYYKFVSIL